MSCRELTDSKSYTSSNGCNYYPWFHAIQPSNNNGTLNASNATTPSTEVRQVTKSVFNKGILCEP